jgi:hypothetical protein
MTADAPNQIAFYKSVKCKRGCKRVFTVYKKRWPALARSPQMVTTRGRTLSI